MIINIDATPQEVAELVFALVDADVELDIDDEDGDTEARKTEILNAVSHALDHFFSQTVTS